MILYTLLAIVLWFVAPLFIAGHVKKRTDRKAWTMLSRIAAILFVLLAICKILP